MKEKGSIVPAFEFDHPFSSSFHFIFFAWVNYGAAVPADAIITDAQALMSISVAPLRESLLTVAASVGSFTNMRSDVVQNIAQFGELFVTGQTLKHLI